MREARVSPVLCLLYKEIDCGDACEECMPAPVCVCVCRTTQTLPKALGPRIQQHIEALFDWAMPACLRFVRREVPEICGTEDIALVQRCAPWHLLPRLQLVSLQQRCLNAPSNPPTGSVVHALLVYTQCHASHDEHDGRIPAWPGRRLAPTPRSDDNLIMHK
jgi:hypothetical protein